MKLDRAQVTHVAKLARLALDDAELQRAQVQLSAILEAVDVLTTAQREGPPVAEAEAPAHLRDDTVAAELSETETVANAPAKHGASFTVPRVIE